MYVRIAVIKTNILGADLRRLPLTYARKDYALIKATAKKVA